MALKVYVKQTYSLRSRLISYGSYLLLIVGISLLFWASYPIITFQLFSSFLVKKTYASPIPQSVLTSSLEIASSVLGSQINVGTNLKGFTKASLWFPDAEKIDLEERKSVVDTKEYKLSIPKLDIQDARVIVGGEDLNEGLIHYLPTSLPGEKGNVAIFGHSTLPQLYKKNDYKSIFTYLHTLERGDKIYVNIRGVEYVYEVTEMFIVNPDQIEVLEPTQNESILTLVTCTPPGTYWKRLIVRAKLQDLPNDL